MFRGARARFMICIVTLAAGAALVSAAPNEETDTGKAAFEKIKALAGEWVGTATSEDGPPASVHYRLTGAGSTVMEILFPGTEHEMVSMYHMDGPDLVLQHYCVAGNQPEMKLDAAGSDSNRLVFVFTGGTNLRPERDPHIHGGTITFIDRDHLESEWSYFEEGKETGKNRLLLERRK